MYPNQYPSPEDAYTTKFCAHPPRNMDTSCRNNSKGTIFRSIINFFCCLDMLKQALKLKKDRRGKRKRKVWMLTRWVIFVDGCMLASRIFLNCEELKLSLDKMKRHRGEEETRMDLDIHKEDHERKGKQV